MHRPALVLACLLAGACGLRGGETATILATEPSAYVRAHADSPVRWLPWGEAAFARAREENKPVYLHIGTFTQELARAMREQSFTRAENAATLNEHFVCVVVDRDEHPDLAAFAQAWIGSIKQMQGWPLNLWLTPDLKPFDGATYLPPSDEWGKEGFPNAINRVLNAWQSDADAQRARADEALAALEAAVAGAPAPVDADAVNSTVREAAAGWLQSFDAAQAGFGEPPRRLEPELLRFFLRQEGEGRDAALATLGALAASPMHDPLDGGFFRSAGDPAWAQPTLQKTLADQPRLALAMIEAAGATRPALAGAAYRAIDYALSLGSTGAGFAAAEDATPEAILPGFLWTLDEARAALGDAAGAPVLTALGLTAEGNLPADAYLGVETTGRNLPRFAGEPPPAALLAALRAARASRAAPLRDSLATSGAHGLLLGALVRSSEPRHRAAAAELAAYIRTALILPDGRLRAGPAYATAAPARDYALVADGLLAFAAAAEDAAARTVARALVARADALFWDERSGRYLAAASPLPPGVGARVAPPAPDAGDLPSADSAMLLLLVTHDLGEPARRAALAAAIVADIADSPSLARGDQLLALQAYAAAKR